MVWEGYVNGQVINWYSDVALDGINGRKGGKGGGVHRAPKGGRLLYSVGVLVEQYSDQALLLVPCIQIYLFDEN